MISVTSFPQADIAWLFLCITRDTCWERGRCLQKSVYGLWVLSSSKCGSSPSLPFVWLPLASLDPYHFSGAQKVTQASLGWFSCLLKLCCRQKMSPRASWISPRWYLHGTSPWSFPWRAVAYNYCCHRLLKCIDISAAWLSAFFLLWYVQSFIINVDKYIDGLLRQLIDDTKMVSTKNMIMRESDCKKSTIWAKYNTVKF